jgi:hypothetical protein
MESLTRGRGRAGMLVALAVALVGLAAGLCAASAVARPGANTFTIRSSLDGKKVLPHRVAWIAYPSAFVLFPGVEFLIDGKVVFQNRLTPYAFGSDGRDEATNTLKTGYLVTSWLSPGMHSFTVRARRNPDRVMVSETVVVRVRGASAPPARLAGTWTRDIPTAVPADKNVLWRETVPAGPKRMRIDRRYVEFSGTGPARVRFDFDATSTTLRLGGPVWTGDPNEVGSCEPWGPGATYSWSVSGDALTLAPLGSGDGCRQRGAIVTGEWTRLR